MIYLTSETKVYDNIEKLSYDEIEGYNIPYSKDWDNWTKINNKLYYYKLFNFNELIGEYLCRYLNLDSVHNELAFKKNCLYLVTESFCESGYIYKHSKPETIYDLLSRCKDVKNQNELLDKLLKLISIDIYMRQTDRESTNNITYKISRDKYFDLAKVYDFSNAFGPSTAYTNPHIEIDYSEINYFFDVYPNLEKYLRKLYGLEFMDIIYTILLDYKLEMSPSKLKYYEKEGEKSVKMLKNVL